jgi:hypothetical protein
MKHVSSYLTESGLKKQSTSDWLQSLWSRCAPQALQQTCRAKVFHNHCLTLQVESSIWLSRLRHQQKSLIRQLRQNREFSSLEKIKFEVSPRQETSTVPRPGCIREKLSDENKKMLLSSASDLSDPDLQDSLRRLAETASRT